MVSCLPCSLPAPLVVNAWISVTVGDCSEEADILVTCAPRYHSFLKAVSKHYPASGFLDPSYAASKLSMLLEQEQPISITDAFSMHVGFPMQHRVLSKCRWDSIPGTWRPFLQHVYMPPTVCTRGMLCEMIADADLVSDHIQPAEKATVMCRLPIVTLNKVTLTIIATCHRTQFAVVCLDSRLTEASLLMARHATSSLASTLG